MTRPDLVPVLLDVTIDPCDGSVAPSLQYILIRGFTAMGWEQPKAASEDIAMAILEMIRPSSKPHPMDEGLRRTQAIMSAEKAETSPGDASDEEKELFAAVTKIDLAGAVKHLRNWAAYKADEHCQEYANLIEAQARLIAWFVKERAIKVDATKEACKRAVTELDCMYVNDERVPYGGIPADPESSVWREAIKAAEAAIDRLDVKAEAPAVSVDAIALMIFNDRRKRRGLSSITMDSIDPMHRADILAIDRPTATAIAALITGANS